MFAIETGTAYDLGNYLTECGDMGTLVMKFGGLSVGTTTALTQVLSIILHEHEKWDKLLIVVSALEGVTDNLIEATRQAQISNQRGYRRIVATLRTRHLALIEQLPLGATERQTIQADVDRLLFDMLDQLQSLAAEPSDELQQKTVDRMIGVGERLSARIVAAIIRQNNIRSVAIDTPGMIITDSNYGNALPDIAQSCDKIVADLLPLLDREIVPVITGYIGSTPEGEITTLGRGGSDYTASVVAICARADEVWVWTDVDGMMTTDPRDVDNAQAIRVMSYAEVGEMAYFGARVLHPRMVGPLQQAKIPLRIKNVFKPQQPGTLIFDTKPPKHPPPPKAVTMIQGVGLFADYSGPLSEIAAQVNAVLVDVSGNDVEVMFTSQSSTRTFIGFIVPTSSGPGASRNAVDRLRAALVDDPTGWQVGPVSIVTVIGHQINQMPGMMAQVLQQLGRVKLLDLSPGPSDCSLSIILQPEDSYAAQVQIHNYLLEANADQ
jgi:bifunctional aspartokinase / homoserine dehydrogenase 1